MSTASTPAIAAAVGNTLYVTPDSAELRGFVKVAAKQETPFWCWAAVLEMLLRYNNIAFTQTEVAEIITNQVADSTVPASAIAKISGFHGSGAGGNGRWSAQCEQKQWEQLQPMPPGDLLVGLLSRNRMVVLALEGQHVVAVYKTTFSQSANGRPVPENVAYVDPYTGKSVTKSYTTLRTQASGWWECYAILSKARTF
jgi:hypothetical protein